MGNLRWLVFVFLLFGLATLNIAFNMRQCQQTYVNNRNYPGGPLAYLLEQGASPVIIAGNAETIVISFLADALLVSKTFFPFSYMY